MLFRNLLLLGLAIFAFSCDKDDDPDHDTDPEYAITIMQPTTDAKNFGDTTHVHINFDSGNNMTIHHVSVRFMNTTTSSLVLDMPTDRHVHATSGHHEFHFDLPLTAQWNVSPNSEIQLEAKVWGREAGSHEMIKTINFSVN